MPATLPLYLDGFKFRYFHEEVDSDDDGGQEEQERQGEMIEQQQIESASNAPDPDTCYCIGPTTTPGCKK